SGRGGGGGAGRMVKGRKQEGGGVEKGEPLYELDTDKVTQEVEADASGVLLRIAVQEGEVPVGGTVAVIGGEGGGGAPAMNGGGGRGGRRGARSPSRPSMRFPRSATAGASRPLRSRGGSPANAGSTSRRSPGPGPRGGSSAGGASALQ